MQKLNLVLSNSHIKRNKQPYKQLNKQLKFNSSIHPVNSVLTDIVSKKPFKSCGCGK